MYSSLALAFVAMFMTSQWSSVESHGRLWTPPGRATMWRKGFKTPANYNDNQLFCGGQNFQKTNDYKCGICGDPFNSDLPHEAGGKYATGTIADTYTQGQEVVLEVDLTANHKGWFEFKICPTNDYKKKADQECLDKHVLELSDGSGTKLDVSELGSNMISIPVMLPEDLTCDFCVLQWRYHCGNNWGGYTDQEEFYGCADIKIIPNNKTTSPSEAPKPPKSDKVTAEPKSSASTKKVSKVSPDIFKLSTKLPASEESTKKTKPFIPPHLDKPKIFDNIKPRMKLRCKAKVSTKGVEEWCNMNCPKKNCPKSLCKCQEVPAVPSDL